MAGAPMQVCGQRATNLRVPWIRLVVASLGHGTVYLLAEGPLAAQSRASSLPKISSTAQSRRDVQHRCARGKNYIPKVFLPPQMLYQSLSRVMGLDKDWFKRTFVNYFWVHSPYYPQRSIWNFSRIRTCTETTFPIWLEQCWVRYGLASSQGHPWLLR